MLSKKNQLILFVAVLATCFVCNVRAASQLINKIFTKTKKCTIHVICQDYKDIDVQVPVYGMGTDYFRHQDLCNAIEDLKEIPVANQLIYSFEYRERLREGCEYRVKDNKLVYLFEKPKNLIV